ncbi:MAG TPA: hypothetical protein VHB79_10495 [Polyangiaceae bacterium]|nr:hypothetical protein [Polyangiaceae bacterium]
MTTDERDKSSRKQESKARVTARDVPFVRGAGSESEPAPRGHRPAELPRDPTYEAELANVELAVLRDRERRDDPSTKQGGRRGHQLPPGQPPESVTPESPGTRATRDVALGRSPEPPSSSGRSVASGTLLSVGSVDPRGKTERTLETPRMYFSRPDTAGEAYFKPGKIPSVTVHQTIETETVKLSDSIDPRRAKTLPRIDRAALLRYAEREEQAESEGNMALSQGPASLDVQASEQEPRWNQDEYESGSLPSELEADGQIHASLSPFRDQQEPSYDYDAGVPTRAEPLAARRLSEEPPPPPDPSTVPTQRDLPQHRIEASRPPPPPAASSSPRAAVDSAIPMSEGPRPTTASIIEDPPARPIWQNAAAFAVALLVALALGWWLTGAGSSHQTAREAPGGAPSAAVPAAPIELKPVAPLVPAAEPAPPAPPPVATPRSAPAAAAPAVRTPQPARAGAVQASPANAAPPAPPKQTPAKSPRETIF